MDTAELRMNLGPHEFEAEGPRESEAAHFEAWKQLIAAHPITPVTVEPAAVHTEACLPKLSAQAGGVHRVDSAGPEW